MKKHIAVIEAAHVSTRAAGQAIRSLGFEPVFLCAPNGYGGDIQEQLQEFENIAIDTSAVELVVQTIQKLCESREVCGIFTLMDRHMRVACLAAQALALPGIDISMLNLLDKGYVAKLVPEFSPQFSVFQPDNIPAEELGGLIKRRGTLMVKPTLTSASIGSFSICDENDLTKLEDLIEHNSTPSLRSSAWIAEEFIDGTMASLEGFVFRGQCHFLGVTRRGRIKNTLTRASFPAERTFSPCAISTAKNAINQLVARSGYANGYFHSEFIFDHETCFLIDANFGRVAGGAISQLIAIAHGIEHRDVLAHVVDLSLFHRNDIASSNYANSSWQALGITYGLNSSSTLKSISLTHHGSVLHTQLHEKESLVPALGVDGKSWIGILAGLEEDVTQTLADLCIFTEKGPMRPVY